MGTLSKSPLLSRLLWLLIITTTLSSIPLRIDGLDSFNGLVEAGKADAGNAIDQAKGFVGNVANATMSAYNNTKNAGENVITGTTTTIDRVVNGTKNPGSVINGAAPGSVHVQGQPAAMLFYAVLGCLASLLIL